MQKIITQESELQEVAQKILNAYPQERVFGFYGEMGAGKTTLIKEFCKILEVVSQTSSPTFAIINEYFTVHGEPVYHFDFYRINEVDELRQIGMEEYLNSDCYCFMEWTEKAEPVLKNNFIRIDIAIMEDGKRVFKY